MAKYRIVKETEIWYKLEKWNWFFGFWEHVSSGDSPDILKRELFPEVIEEFNA